MPKFTEKREENGMKKKLLSLTLALVLCLGLTTPAMAAQPYTYSENDITITNVIQVEQKEGMYSTRTAFTCVAPVTFGAWDLAEGDSSRLYVMTYADPGKITLDNFDLSENMAEEVQTDTVTEPGTYMITVMVDYADGTRGFSNYLLIVQSGGGSPDPDPAPTPAITDPSTTAPLFSDVAPGDWFYEPVGWAVENNITAGTGNNTFSPEVTCTQAQILTFLWRAMGSPAPAGAVSSDQYYAQAAQWALEHGIIDGFEADTPCTRAMVVTYLWRLAGRPETAGSQFADVPADAGYAQAVAWAVQNGITSGTGDNTFSPDTTCTRGQIVTFLYRAYGDADAVQEAAVD